MSEFEFTAVFRPVEIEFTGDAERPRVKVELTAHSSEPLRIPDGSEVRVIYTPRHEQVPALKAIGRRARPGGPKINAIRGLGRSPWPPFVCVDSKDEVVANVDGDGLVWVVIE